MKPFQVVLLLPLFFSGFSWGTPPQTVTFQFQVGMEKIIIVNALTVSTHEGKPALLREYFGKNIQFSNLDPTFHENSELILEVSTLCHLGGLLDVQFSMERSFGIERDKTLPSIPWKRSQRTASLSNKVKQKVVLDKTNDGKEIWIEVTATMPHHSLGESTLVSRQPNLVPGLLRALKVRSTQESAKEALLNLGKDIVPFAIQALSSDDTQLRHETASILEELTKNYSPEEAIPALLRCLEDPDPGLQTKAARTLKAIIAASRRQETLPF